MSSPSPSAIGETLFDTAAQSIMPDRRRPTDGLARANGRLYAVELTANQFVGPPLGGVLVGAAAALALAGAAPRPTCSPPSCCWPCVGTFRPDARRRRRPRSAHRHRRGRPLPRPPPGAAHARHLRRHLEPGVHRGVRRASRCSPSSPGRWGCPRPASAAADTLAPSARWSARWSPTAVERALGRTARSRSPSLLFPLGAADAGDHRRRGRGRRRRFVVAASSASSGTSSRCRCASGSSPTHLLGRVNAGYRLLAWGTMPLGALLGGVARRVVRAAGDVLDRRRRSASCACRSCSPVSATRPIAAAEADEPDAARRPSAAPRFADAPAPDVVLVAVGAVVVAGAAASAASPSAIADRGDGPTPSRAAADRAVRPAVRRSCSPPPPVARTAARPDRSARSRQPTALAFDPPRPGDGAPRRARRVVCARRRRRHRAGDVVLDLTDDTHARGRRRPARPGLRPRRRVAVRVPHRRRAQDECVTAYPLDDERRARRGRRAASSSTVDHPPSEQHHGGGLRVRARRLPVPRPRRRRRARRPAGQRPGRLDACSARCSASTRRPAAPSPTASRPTTRSSAGDGCAAGDLGLGLRNPFRLVVRRRDRRPVDRRRRASRAGRSSTALPAGRAGGAQLRVGHPRGHAPLRGRRAPGGEPSSPCTPTPTAAGGAPSSAGSSYAACHPGARRRVPATPTTATAGSSAFRARRRGRAAALLDDPGCGVERPDRASSPDPTASRGCSPSTATVVAAVPWPAERAGDAAPPGTGRSSGWRCRPSARWSPSRCTSSPTPPSSGTSARRSSPAWRWRRRSCSPATPCASSSPTARRRRWPGCSAPATSGRRPTRRCRACGWRVGIGVGARPSSARARRARSSRLLGAEGDVRRPRRALPARQPARRCPRCSLVAGRHRLPPGPARTRARRWSSPSARPRRTSSLELVLIYGFGYGIGALGAGDRASPSGARPPSTCARSAAPRRRLERRAAARPRRRCGGWLVVGGALRRAHRGAARRRSCWRPRSPPASAPPRSAAHQIAFEIWSVARPRPRRPRHRRPGDRRPAASAPATPTRPGPPAAGCSSSGVVAGVVAGALVRRRCGRVLPDVFTDDPAVARPGRRSCCGASPRCSRVNGVVFVLDGLLIGAGDLRFLAGAMVGAAAVFAVAAARRARHRPRHRLAVGGHRRSSWSPGRPLVPAARTAWAIEGATVAEPVDRRASAGAGDLAVEQAQQRCAEGRRWPCGRSRSSRGAARRRSTTAAAATGGGQRRAAR